MVLVRMNYYFRSNGFNKVWFLISLVFIYDNESQTHTKKIRNITQLYICMYMYVCNA